MADTATLRELLHEMERARSPLQRLRLVALAWRTIRGLSPKEREDIALKVGMAEAGELVERLAVRDGGVAPTELLEAIHAAETADPRKLRQLVGSLKDVIHDPEQRRGLLHRAVEALDAAAQAGTPAAAAVAAAETVTPPEGLPRPGPSEAPPKPTSPPAPQPRPATVLPPRTKPSPGPALRPAQPPALSAPARQAATPPPPPPPATPRPSRLPPDAPSISALAPDALPPTSRRRLVSRLTALHRRAGVLRGEGLQRLRQEVTELPPGWPRRRAVCALLEAGLPATTDDALELVGDLQGERDRAWCLTLLLCARRVSDRELEAALEMVSSPARRARLRRLAGSGPEDE